MHYYFVVFSHKTDLNLSHLCNLGNLLGSSVEISPGFAHNGPLLPIGNLNLLNLMSLGCFLWSTLLKLLRRLAYLFCWGHYFLSQEFVLSQNYILSIQLHETFFLTRALSWWLWLSLVVIESMFTIASSRLLQNIVPPAKASRIIFVWGFKPL